jgi:hypothetical protein
MKYLTIILLIGLFGCQEDPIQPQQPQAPTLEVYCDYNGQTIDYSDIISASKTGNMYTITAVNDNGTTETDDDKGIQLVFTADQTGTIQLTSGQGSANYIAFTFSNPNATMFSQFTPNPGTINITEIDETNKSISGTFQTDISNTSQTQTDEAINGYFEIEYL